MRFEQLTGCPIYDPAGIIDVSVRNIGPFLVMHIINLTRSPLYNATVQLHTKSAAIIYNTGKSFSIQADECIDYVLFVDFHDNGRTSHERSFHGTIVLSFTDKGGDFYTGIYAITIDGDFLVHIPGDISLMLDGIMGSIRFSKNNDDLCNYVISGLEIRYRLVKAHTVEGGVMRIFDSPFFILFDQPNGSVILYYDTLTIRNDELRELSSILRQTNSNVVHAPSMVLELGMRLAHVEDLASLFLSDKGVDKEGLTHILRILSEANTYCAQLRLSGSCRSLESLIHIIRIEGLSLNQETFDKLFTQSEAIIIGEISAIRNKNLHTKLKDGQIFTKKEVLMENEKKE